MRAYKSLLALATAGLLGISGCSGSDHSGHTASAPPKPANNNVRLTLLPQDAPVPGKPITILAKLNTLPNGHILTDTELDTVHTQKFHLLVVDPSLTDYQHIHPQPTATPGVYSFSFTPKLGAGYRAWADITPSLTHTQQFAHADIGSPRLGMVSKIETHEANAGNYHFTLSFDSPPAVGKASMGSIQVSDKKGEPVTSFEPVMGANAHIVGFYDDFRTAVHTHPMDGPELMFHLEPSKPGFIKLFAQVKINGQELFVPFGVHVSSP